MADASLPGPRIWLASCALVLSALPFLALFMPSLGLDLFEPAVVAALTFTGRPGATGWLAAILSAGLLTWALQGRADGEASTQAARGRFARFCLWLFRAVLVLPPLLFLASCLDLNAHLHRHPNEHGTFLAIYFGLPILVEFWLVTALPVTFAAWVTRTTA